MKKQGPKCRYLSSRRSGTENGDSVGISWRMDLVDTRLVAFFYSSVLERSVDRASHSSLFSLLVARRKWCNHVNDAHTGRMNTSF